MLSEQGQHQLDQSQRSRNQPGNPYSTQSYISISSLAWKKTNILNYLQTPNINNMSVENPKISTQLGNPICHLSNQRPLIKKPQTLTTKMQLGTSQAQEIHPLNKSPRLETSQAPPTTRNHQLNTTPKAMKKI